MWEEGRALRVVRAGRGGACRQWFDVVVCGMSRWCDCVEGRGGMEGQLALYDPPGGSFCYSGPELLGSISFYVSPMAGQPEGGSGCRSPAATRRPRLRRRWTLRRWGSLCGACWTWTRVRVGEGRWGGCLDGGHVGHPCSIALGDTAPLVWCRTSSRPAFVD